jgi:hypothetical protein
VRTNYHTRRSIESKELFEREEHNLDKDGKRFFRLFQESTFEGSRAAALEMRKVATRCTYSDQKSLLVHSLRLLDAFMAKQSASCVASVRRSQYVVRKRVYSAPQFGRSGRSFPGVAPIPASAVA